MISAFRSLAKACLATLLVSLSTGAFAQLEAGSGRYDFDDPVRDAKMTVFYYKPTSYTSDSPIVIVMTGINRNADEYRDAWVENAEKHNFLVLTPLFSQSLYPGVNGYNQGNVMINKDSTSRNDRDVWAFTTLDRLWADFKTRRDQTRRDKYFLYGHSAGCQFVHRMMMFNPGADVDMAVCTSAGWYTMPDYDIRWPYGLEGTGISESDMKAFLTSNFVLGVGENDTDPGHYWLRRTPEAMVQGTQRRQRANQFHEKSKVLAEKLGVELFQPFLIIPGAGHNKDQVSAWASNFIGHYASTGQYLPQEELKGSGSTKLVPRSRPNADLSDEDD